MKSRILSSLLVMGLLLGSLSGCGNQSKTDDKSSEKQIQTEQGNSSVAESEQDTGDALGYPIEEDVTLTVAMVHEENVTSVSEDLAATPFGQAWQEATGVKFEVQYVADNTAMQLLLTSGDLPDIIWWDFGQYAGGIKGAVEDGIVQPLDENLIQFAPDLTAWYDSADEIYRSQAYADDGSLYGFPYMREQSICSWVGLMIRQDWLDELELEQPQTPEEFYNVLKIFKEEKGAEYPFSATADWLWKNGVGNGIITSAFGLPQGDFYKKDGTVHYGYAEQEYKDVLAWLNMLYSEGLLDPNLQTIGSDVMLANVMNGHTGVYLWGTGSIASLEASMQESNPEFAIAGLSHLVAEKGDTPMSGQYANPFGTLNAVITPNCENKEAAVRFLNYAYTEEGNLLFNVGIEGESYVINEDGKTEFTEFITNNPDGLDMSMAKAQYEREWNGGPFVQKFYDALYANPRLADATKKYSNTDALTYKILGIDVSDENSSEYSKIMADVKSYVSEMFIKYVTGMESLDTFETEYLATLEQMKIERAIEIWQEALDEANAQ